MGFIGIAGAVAGDSSPWRRSSLLYGDKIMAWGPGLGPEPELELELEREESEPT